ncbi:hypothetical protein T459_04739 [Capsicum annuum]|uniref:Uncharacterized protein n=1 Tax=Capsicum annuum TaxID=4072 RepID=A0A2G3A5V7_CAPAN|nr:hypothetical protein T459_04739 [Capsicum annuum]
MVKFSAAYISCSCTYSLHNNFLVPKLNGPRILLSQAKQKLVKSQMIDNATTYTSRIATDIPLYEIPGASFDRYLDNKPRIFKAIFPDKRRSQQLNQEEWRIHMLPIEFLLITVWPVIDMRLRCKSKGIDYPPGIPPDVSKVLELDIIRWELQGLDDVMKPSQFSLGVKGSLYPDRNGPRSRLKGQLQMSISFVLPPVLALVPEAVRRDVTESVRCHTCSISHDFNFYTLVVNIRSHKRFFLRKNTSRHCQFI